MTGGKTIDMAQFKGKYVLCVNVASYCGYTKQYTALINLQKRYGSKLVVIGFPCNQFGEQEPGTPSEITNFCKIPNEFFKIRGSQIKFTITKINAYKYSDFVYFKCNK